MQLVTAGSPTGGDGELYSPVPLGAQPSGVHMNMSCARCGDTLVPLAALRLFSVVGGATHAAASCPHCGLAWRRHVSTSQQALIAAVRAS